MGCCNKRVELYPGCRRLCTQRALFRNGRSLVTVRQSDKEQ